MAELLQAVKLNLGIRHDKIDFDILETIEACKLDLGVAGVGIVDPTNPLVRQAVKLYCRAHYNFQGEADRYTSAYTALKNSLALCGDFHENE